MIDKSIFSGDFPSVNGKLSIAAGFMMMPTFLFAQTKQEVQAIRRESNLSALEILKEGFRKTTLSTPQLQKIAKQRQIPFAGKSKNKYFQLKGFDKKGRALYYITTNAGAAAGTSTDKLGTDFGVFNLEGSQMKIHEWDGGGTRTTHQEFGGRAIQKDIPFAESDHATHVAGTMIASGVVPEAKGMAPKATLDTYDWNDDEQEMTQAASEGALVSNHSYGFNGGFDYGDYSGNEGWHWIGEDEDTEYKFYGKYTEIDRNYDLIALNAPMYLQVKAAGNPRGDGPEPGERHFVRVKENDQLIWRESTKVRDKNGGAEGYDCINHGALGKNILVVGAAHKIEGGYKKPEDVVMASFSAFGPVDDGRIKPDISGVGFDILSSYSDSDRAYASISGTSMASPNVSGALLLLQEHYKNLHQGKFMRAATLKALAIHTANEAGDHPGPDYKSGWGLLNAHKAAVTISAENKHALISENKLNNRATETINVTATGTEPLIVTVVWADPVAKVLPDQNVNDAPTKVLVNDLDVRVRHNGQEFFPWKLDPSRPSAPATKGDNVVDNVEQIVIPNPEAGSTYEIIISHKDDLMKNSISLNSEGENVVELLPAESQDYSLIATGISVGNVKDLSLKKISVKVPESQYTTQTPIEFQIENKESIPALGGKLKYQLLDVDNNREVSKGEIEIDRVEPHSVLKKEINLDLSQSFVDFKLIATIEFPGDEVAENNKEEINIYGYMADLSQGNAKYGFGFEESFIKNGWTSEDVDGDGKTWRKYDSSELSLSGRSFAVNFPKGNQNSNDWLFSNPLKLKGGTTYRVALSISKFDNIDESIELFYGDEPISTAMLNKIGEKIEAPSDGSYKKVFFDFSVPKDQITYIGFHNKTEGESYAIAVDDFSVRNAKMPIADFTAKDFSNTYEPITFESNATAGIANSKLSYEWTFTPNTVSFVDGTSNTSSAPKVKFNEEGQYSVQLKVTDEEKNYDIINRPESVNIANLQAKAVFRESNDDILEGEVIEFTNYSEGNPVPNEYEWTITPSDNNRFEFVEGNATSENISVKFNKFGVYTVSLKVKSLHNEDIAVKKDIVKVSGLHEPVKNLKANFDDKIGELKMTWERPNLQPHYYESFEQGEIPSDMTSYDANNDGSVWEIGDVSKYKGEFGAISYSWLNDSFTADDWLVTPKLKKGAELLKYAVKHQFKERYDVYVVEAPESGKVPTVEEIKKGHKVYSFEGDVLDSNFFVREINIKNITSKDFFVAFHHRTQKEDEGFLLGIDDISVGYVNTPTQNSDTSEKTNNKTSGIVKSLSKVKQKQAVKAPIQNLGVTDYPKLVGYEIAKNGSTTKSIEGADNTSYTEKIKQNGIYTYDVYAVYSDGVKSDKRTVTVDVSSLYTSNIVRVYPNPSNGLFVVEAKIGISSLKAEVYDMAGKLIFKKDYQGNKADLDLTQYPKGIYILNLVDNNGGKQSAKLMIK
ncbi:MAG: S8 family serine peptidase [Flavobacteriaceae bacterium]|nr:S8 family serine peptidase [Flavobacteriaceae bacterium]